MATNRYRNGKIYRLVNSVDTEIYVGSTCTSLSKRIYKHKSDAKEQTDRRVYAHLNPIGWDNVDIILIEEYPCQNKMELERRERHWIETLKASLNTYLPTRSHKEYDEDNKEKRHEYYEENKKLILENKREYYEKNKEVIAENKREYVENNKDKIAEYQKEYRENNKAKNAEYQKVYRVEYDAKNKEKIAAKQREWYLKKKASQQSST